MLTAPVPLRVAMLSSHRAPGLGVLLAHVSHGPLFQIVGLEALDRRGLRRGQLLGAPWELTTHGQLRATYEAAIDVSVSRRGRSLWQ
jgi:hypothetical protein